jgi:hypothetical protein
MVPISCSETSARNYHYWLRNIPEERRSPPLCGGSLKSRIGSNIYILTSQIMLIIMLVRKVNIMPQLVYCWLHFLMADARILQITRSFLSWTIVPVYWSPTVVRWRCRKHGQPLHRTGRTSYSDKIHKAFCIQALRGIDDKLDICMQDPKDIEDKLDACMVDP